MKTRKAFTLIELLVVIAIIAILAAILFPVFAQAKLAAKKAADLSSVKQISLSATIYSGDVDDVAPTQNPDVNGFPDPWYAGSGKDLGYMDPTIVQCWAAAIQPYIKSLQLPVSVAAPKDPDPNFGYRNKAGAGNNTWAFNGNMMGKSLTSMSAPAELIAFQSKLTTTRESIVQPTIWDGTNKNCNGVDLNWMGNTYGKGGNYGWADGHASYKLRTAVTFRNLGMSGIVHRNSQSGWSDVSNTQGLTDPAKNNNFWDTWGECKVENM
jgi:prepilin-type N-terminal cleavage/methylation domain-containing protein/prepilin-type processing-associated H-X9-DG protein